MKKHFSKYVYHYMTVVSLAGLLIFNYNIKPMILWTGLPYVAISIICVIICVWWLLHLTAILKIKHTLIKRFTNNLYKRLIAIFVIMTLGYLMIKLDNIEFSPVSDIILAATVGYYWANGLFKIISYIKFKRAFRDIALNEEQYNRVTEYMQTNQYFFIADHSVRDIYTLKINFPAHLHKEITEMLAYYLKDPKAAYLISEIFKNNVKFDDDNNIYLNDKLETNPSKIGLFIMNKLSENAPSEINVTITDIKS